MIARVLLLTCTAWLLISCEAGAKPSGNGAADLLDQPGGRRVVGHASAAGNATFVKRGGPDGAWCKWRVGKVEGWRLCDRTDDPPRTVDKPSAPLRCPSHCDHPPLFDAPLDLTPVEKAVLRLCPSGADGTVSAADAWRFLATVIDDARLQRALSAAGRPANREANLDWLVSLWIGTGPKNAFTHVFCGDDWAQDDLGGLHWAPRFAELEADGRICFEGPVRGRSPVGGGQYLVRYHALAPWSCGRKSVGGFALRTDPVEMLAIATRAFARCCGDGRDGGVYRARDLGGPAWKLWCGKRNGTYGIATMYPVDDAPTCSE